MNEWYIRGGLESYYCFKSHDNFKVPCPKPFEYYESTSSWPILYMISWLAMVTQYSDKCGNLHYSWDLEVTTRYWCFEQQIVMDLGLVAGEQGEGIGGNYVFSLKLRRKLASEEEKSWLYAARSTLSRDSNTNGQRKSEASQFFKYFCVLGSNN